MAKENVDVVVAEFRNIHMQVHLSPSEMFFRQRLRGELPQLRTHMDLKEGMKLCEAARDQVIRGSQSGRVCLDHDSKR